VPSTLAGLDERRAYLDEMDPLQAGGWKLVEGDEWRIGKLPAGDDALWAMIERADARFGCDDTSDEARMRFARAKSVNQKKGK
jgi:hypothetical protein